MSRLHEFAEVLSDSLIIELDHAYADARAEGLQPSEAWGRAMNVVSMALRNALLDAANKSLGGIINTNA